MPGAQHLDWVHEFLLATEEIVVIEPISTVASSGRIMIEPRVIRLDHEATLALSQILGIMLDQLFELEASQGWSTEHIIDLDARLVDSLESESITLGINDAALLLQGMAFTELMSVDLPWFETVQWVTDFVTSELRQHWSDQEWLTFTS